MYLIFFHVYIIKVNSVNIIIVFALCLKQEVEQMRITLRRTIDAGDPQGYWSEIVLEHTEEEFITHPQYGRIRITSCEQTETRCGLGRGCFQVSETTVQQEPLIIRALALKRAGWEIIESI